MNHARRQVSCLVRHHDTGDGRVSQGAAMRMRRSIYCVLAEVVRSAESISDRLPKAGKALASEIRRDAAWAYRATRDMAAVLDAPECGVLPQIDLLPDTSSEIALPDGGSLPSIDMRDTPRDTGPLTKRLRQAGAYLRLYALAVSRKDGAIAQDLRAAIHDSLEDISRRVAARVAALRKFGMAGDAEATEQDWAWVAEVLAPIAKALPRDGVREKSMAALIAAEILPTAQDISAIREHSPTGLWARKMSRHLATEADASKRDGLSLAWERFRNGFRPGRKEVILLKETELVPSGDGGGLGMFEFNEIGHIRRVSTPLEPMVYIGHMRCPACAAFTDEDADKCPECGGGMDGAKPPQKAHVPMAYIPEISKAGSVRCLAGETLLAGAIKEVCEVGGERCAVVHMSKPESKRVRSKGGPVENMLLVQWLVSGETSWVSRDGLRLVAKQVFVYGQAIMGTTIGQAHFCFGAWVNFGDIEVQDSPFKFQLGDDVEVADAKLIRYEAAVIGGGKADDQHAGKCTGVVVRVPERATDQTEPMYDVRIGNTVVMHQAESGLRPRRGKRSCKPNPKIRHMAYESYNAFDADGYQRYRSG